jgi:hypothetical protein
VGNGREGRKGSALDPATTIMLSFSEKSSFFQTLVNARLVGDFLTSFFLKQA